jgi:hypothetical protein
VSLGALAALAVDASQRRTALFFWVASPAARVVEIDNIRFVLLVARAMVASDDRTRDILVLAVGRTISVGGLR